MKRLVAITLIGPLLAPSGLALGQDAGAASGRGGEARSAPLPHMDHAVLHLLEAIRAMREGPPRPTRDRAMEEARQALMRTEEARTRTMDALGLAEAVEDNPHRSARAAFGAVLQAQDLAARGDRARVRYAIERAEHALSMAGLDPLEEVVVKSWLDEARSALRRGERPAVRQALEQAEWALRANIETPRGPRLKSGG